MENLKQRDLQWRQSAKAPVPGRVLPWPPKKSPSNPRPSISTSPADRGRGYTTLAQLKGTNGDFNFTIGPSYNPALASIARSTPLVVSPTAQQLTKHSDRPNNWNASQPFASTLRLCATDHSSWQLVLRNNGLD